MNNIDEKLKDRLVKLYELVKRGEKGEKDNAEFLMNRLLSKHNLTIEDITQDLPKERYYKYTTAFNKVIVCQVIYKVTNRSEVYNIKSYKEVCCSVNDFEHVQILEMIDFHLENSDKERKQLIKDLSSAYVQKHRLYRKTNPEDNEDRKPLTLEEKQALWRMANLTDILSDNTYTKKLE